MRLVCQKRLQACWGSTLFLEADHPALWHGFWCWDIGDACLHLAAVGEFSCVIAVFPNGEFMTVAIQVDWLPVLGKLANDIFAPQLHGTRQSVSHMALP